MRASRPAPYLGVVLKLAGTSLRATALVAAVGALLVFGPSALAAAETPSDETGSVRITEDKGTGDDGAGDESDSVRITEDVPDNRDF